MISIQRLEKLYSPIKNQIQSNPLKDGMPDLADVFVGTNPVDVYQYGQDAYHKHKEKKKARSEESQEIDTFTANTPGIQN